MITIIRVWDENDGWMYEVQRDGVPFDRSKHRDDLEERYPPATPSGAVVCGDNIYPEDG